jgi:glycosyltransferase involved in cell wall biosynthesis
MHVAFLITRSDAMGGASVHVRDMAAALNRSGYQATVLIGGQGGEVIHRLEEARVRTIRVPQLDRAIHPLSDLAAIFAVRAELARLRPDVVSTHTAKAGLVGRVAAASLGLPVLYTPHGWTITDRISPWSGRVFRLAERAAAPLATRIVNVCEAERELAIKHRIGSPEKLSVIHNGVVDFPASRRANPSLDPPRITMVARFEAPKDHATLLSALASLKELPWQLDLVGGGPLQPGVRGLAERLGLAARITFHGEGAPVAERLGASQMFVLSSRSEGFPRSILEAMRAGLPVVASDVGGAGEAVLHGKSGMVVAREDAKALAGALVLLIRSAALRRRMGEAGRARYEAHFTFDRMFEMNLAVYRQSMRGTQPVPADRQPVTVDSVRRVS